MPDARPGFHIFQKGKQLVNTQDKYGKMFREEIIGDFLASSVKKVGFSNGLVTRKQVSAGQSSRLPRFSEGKASREYAILET